ncbi:heparinase II/III domain-containing protein [Yunchengibacter salinarum]|uniref:heparinase II/III domain-containing protein n=1 Tax=Yunchengibacter salinarum TaxID=3133399 RepID=UPI0035B66F47
MKAIKKVEVFEKEGFSPVKRPDLPPYRMSIPFDWAGDPFNDPNWRFQIQTLRYLMIYFEAYKETEEYRYLEILLSWFEDWWVSSKSTPNEFTWHDMATGIRAEKIHILASELESSGIKLPRWFKEMILKHVAVIRKEGFVRTSHNHGLYAAHGLRCLAEHLGVGQKKNVIQRSYELVSEIIKNQFDENYVHKEHSPHYHHLVLKSLKDYRNSGLYSGLSILDSYIEKVEAVSRHLLLPDGREVPFGDTDNQKERNNLGNQMLSGNELWCTSGYAIYKNGLSYLCMTNNYNSNIHKHWDNLSFILGKDGQDILVDPGKYKYVNNEIREKVISSAAHNTISFECCPWSGSNLRKNEMELKGALEEKGVLFSGCILLKIKDEFIRVFRSVNFDYNLSKLSVVDKVVNDRKNFRPAYSRYVLHKDARLISCNRNSVLFSFGKIKVNFVIESSSSGYNSLDQLYMMDKTPVSYEHGSYFDCYSLQVKNIGTTELSAFIIH